MALFSAREAAASSPLMRAGRALVPVEPHVGLRGLALAKWPSGLIPHGRFEPDAALGPSLGQLGSLEVRLATTGRDVRRAQRLRFKVFYDERAAAPNPAALVLRRDRDRYDAVCDHLLVLDHDVARTPFRAAGPAIVGTYRLLRQEVAERRSGLYSSHEYDVAPLLAAHPGLRFLELGRSCVLKPYRTKRTVELLWRGVWAYVRHHKIDVMLGCASFEGVDPDAHSLPLSFLHHRARAPEPWRARAHPERAVAMDRIGPEAIDPKAALKALPPLIKGYLRLGAMVGEGAVVDHQFGVTDVLIILPVAAISRRYVDHFGPAEDRHSLKGLRPPL